MAPAPAMRIVQSNTLPKDNTSYKPKKLLPKVFFELPRYGSPPISAALEIRRSVAPR